jgi:hypothetical protein
MADYFAIKDIFASTDNMVKIRDNSPNDDSTDTLTGVDWFHFNNVVASNIYVNGNSWIGVGTNAEQVKVCRRDAKVYTVSREEGTVYNYYKFLRIRWEGYSQYNVTTDDVKLVWELLLLDTGDIVINVITYPTNTSYIGESSLVVGSTTTAFTPVAGKYITFKHQDATGTAFVLSTDLPALLDPYNRRYLITDADKSLYTVVDGALSKLTETELTAAVFETHGIQEIPNGSLLLTLTDPTVLYWHDSLNSFPPFTASYTGLPKPQVIYSENIDMTDASIIGIEKVTVDADDAALFAVSFDNGTTWWTYTDNTWSQLSEEKSGMTKTALQGISTDAWAEKATTGMIKYRIVISGDSGYVKTITTDYLNKEE